MWVSGVQIDGVGGIKSLVINFNRHMNILCGPNGIGKTTILECVAHLFTAGEFNLLKKNAMSANGKVLAFIETDGHEGRRQVHLEVNQFSPDKHDSANGSADLSAKMFSLKVNRTFDYAPLHAVTRDTEKPLHVTYAEARSGIKLQEVKSWLVNRHLYSLHKTLTESQLSNYDLARTSFSILDPKVSFSHVEASTNEIMVKTDGGDIYYEYLSSGFKSCFSIVLGIIKEIEFRFKNPGISAAEFDGVILIDEVELHLHPSWQAVILPSLSKLFPKSQIICTTHSPHVIQAARTSEIIAIESVNGATRQRCLPDAPFGFKGWTVEEILTDVMGMEDVRTKEYRDAISSFDTALDEGDADRARRAYKTLDEMIHPSNHLKKILRLQLSAAGLVDD